MILTSIKGILDIPLLPFASIQFRSSFPLLLYSSFTPLTVLPGEYVVPSVQVLINFGASAGTAK